MHRRPKTTDSAGITNTLVVDSAYFFRYNFCMASKLNKAIVAVFFLISVLTIPLTSAFSQRWKIDALLEKNSPPQRAATDSSQIYPKHEQGALRPETPNS